MGGYVREFDVALILADGESITIRLKPAKVSDLLKLNGVTRDSALISEFQTALTDYIVDMKGPTDAAGGQISKEEFLSAAYFMKAVLDLGTEWLKRAAPRNPQSPDALPSA